MLFYRRPIGTVGIMSGVPANYLEFTWAWGQMIAYNYEYLLQPDEMVHLARTPLSYHAEARNYLARNFMGDWILMLDMDHTFEPDILARMLALTRRYEVDVLTAHYRYKNPPYLLNHFGWDEATKTYYTIAELQWDQRLQEIATTGAGTLLIRRTVFDRIREELGEEPFNILPAEDGTGRQLSEDFSFLTRCRKLGIKVFTAPQIESKHLVTRAIGDEDYQRDQVQTFPVPSGGEAVVPGR